MPAAGDTKIEYGRSYVWLVPNQNAPGAWRLTTDDNASSGNVDQSALASTGFVEAGVTIGAKQLVYITSTGTIALADASSITTAKVAGVAVSGASAGQAITYTRNQPVSITNVSTIVDNAPATLETGKYYFLSATTPGNYTRTPDTSTPGAVVVQVGLALDSANMAIEIQSEVLI